MFREFLKSREFLIGIFFFVMVVFGTGIYAWHVISSTNAKYSETHQSENKNESTPTAVSLEKVDFDTSETQNDATDGTTEHTPSTPDTQEPFITHQTAPIDNSDAVAVARDTTADGTKNDVRVAQETADKASDEGQEITPEEQETERERRKRAGEIIERFMQMPAEGETPISKLNAPELIEKLREMGVSLEGTAKYYRHIPPEVREAQRILQSDERP